MLLSQEPKTDGEAYQALFEQPDPLQKRIGVGSRSSVYALRGTNLVVKICALTTSYRYSTQDGPLSLPVEVEFDQGILRSDRRYDITSNPVLFYGTYMACIEAEALEFLHRTGAPPFLCSLEDHYFVKADDQLYKVMVEKRCPGVATAYRTRSALEVALLIDQMGKMLDHFDRIGFIYRDLKPENIIQRVGTHSRLGDIKVIDFGAASFTPGTVLPPILGSLHHQRERYYTSSGCVIGSAGFMSPEQTRGLELTPKTDLFSFGMTLVEILTGINATLKTSASEAIAMIASTPWTVQENAMVILRDHAIDERVQRGIKALLEQWPWQRSLEPIQQAALEILAERGYDAQGVKLSPAVPSQ